MGISTDLQNEIEDTVNRAMQTWNVPGLALVIVKDDKVAIAKGFGVREMNKPEEDWIDPLEHVFKRS